MGGRTVSTLGGLVEHTPTGRTAVVNTGLTGKTSQMLPLYNRCRIAAADHWGVLVSEVVYVTTVEVK